ncbi:MAG: ATP-binding cassette domain-containing protein [Campylobacteraceae bacterium]|nr:ATP-binding cassette domain-containing protein [Campylobacteraceae bacterium]
MSFNCQRLFIKTKEKKLLDISFDFDKSYALIGQSGSGKSLTLKALLGMLPANLEHSIKVKSKYKLKRGESVSMVPQNPFTALSPLTKIKKQFFIDKKLAKEYVSLVGLEEDIMQRFPSQLSGGQLQRVIIAMALSIKPKLLLLDEPTTALDKQSKKSILELIKKLQIRDGFDMLFVTHDIASVENLCQKIGIIKEGIIIEEGNMSEVLNNPKDGYTKKLINSGFEKREFRS